MRLSVEELARAMGCAGQKVSPGLVDHFVIDSRKVRRGSLFFALRGEYADGHRFVAGALADGATAAVVEYIPEGVDNDPRLLVVDSVEGALMEAGRVARDALAHDAIVAVTGSCGKTSTKEFLRAALAPLGDVGATEGNLNNHLGVPITLGGFCGSEAACVVELGMNHFGEIDALAEIVRPRVGVITSICPVHLEGVGSLDGVREAKGELLRHISAGGYAVLPEAEEKLIAMAREAGVKVRTFGDRAADFRLTDFSSTLAGARFTLHTPLGQVQVEAPLGGRHQALNAAAALAAATLMGVPLSAAALALRGATLPGERSRLEPHGELTIFNDCYNASPSSMEAVIEMVRESWDGPFHLLLGEMRELGDGSPIFHERLGEVAGSAGAASITYVGDFGSDFERGVRHAGATCALAASPEEAPQFVNKALSAGDLVVVKGSRGVHLERALALINIP